jgi:16S rRNA processing protein RimM
MVEYLQVGAIASTHGIRGEVKVFPTTDDPARFRSLKQVILEGRREKLTLEIEGVKFFKQFVILKFKGYDDINQVEGYKGCTLWVHRKDAVKLGKDENFIADLIGLTVTTDEGTVLGTLSDVLQTGANDVYVVETPEKKELLLPAIKQCILEVNPEEGRILVHLMEGLLDL